MQLENRYTVLKHKDVDQYLNEDEKITLSALCERVDNGRRNNGKASINALVIEKDWPEYNSSLEALSKRVDNADFLMRLHDQIGDDKWTITFQSTGQILGAIRKAIRARLDT